MLFRAYKHKKSLPCEHHPVSCRSLKFFFAIVKTHKCSYAIQKFGIPYFSSILPTLHRNFTCKISLQSFPQFITIIYSEFIYKIIEYRLKKEIAKIDSRYTIHNFFWFSLFSFINRQTVEECLVRLS